MGPEKHLLELRERSLGEYLPLFYLVLVTLEYTIITTNELQALGSWLLVRTLIAAHRDLVIRVQR